MLKERTSVWWKEEISQVFNKLATSEFVFSVECWRFSCSYREENTGSILKYLSTRRNLGERWTFFHYTDWEHANDGYLNQKMIGDVVGDYFFICPTNLFAQIAADRGMKVYYYFFTHRTSTSLWGEWMGVMHGDEIEYVFGHPLNMSLQYNSRERELSLKMMQVFARFASSGKPVTDDINWPLYTKDHPQYFIFNADKTGIGKGPRATPCAFWNDFLPKLREGQGSAETPCEASVVGAVPSSTWTLRPHRVSTLLHASTALILLVAASF